MNDDLELLLAWRDGDKTAGNALVERHFPRVYAFFDGKVAGDADDLVHATFLACFEAADSYRGDASFRAFVLGVARNQLLKYLRKKYRRDRAFRLADVCAEDLGVDPGSIVANREEQRLLVRALRRIPLDFQLAVELYYWEALSTAEIAQVLDIAVGTVRSRLTRARDLLREQIARIGQDSQVTGSTLAALDRWLQSMRRHVPTP